MREESNRIIQGMERHLAEKEQRDYGPSMKDNAAIGRTLMRENKLLKCKCKGTRRTAC